MYLSEVVEDIERALRESDVHGVCWADGDGHARFWKNDKFISMNWTLVLDRVVFHLKEKRQSSSVNPDLILMLFYITGRLKIPPSQMRCGSAGDSQLPTVSIYNVSSKPISFDVWLILYCFNVIVIQTNWWGSFTSCTGQLWPSKEHPRHRRLEHNELHI